MDGISNFMKETLGSAFILVDREMAIYESRLHYVSTKALIQDFPASSPVRNTFLVFMCYLFGPKMSLKRFIHSERSFGN